jgi:hypothetical protein
MATYPPNQTTPVKGSGNYLWNWLGTPLKKFAEALQPYIGGSSDKLVAGSKELTLNSSGDLTLNSGDLRIISPDLDVILQAQDDVRLEAQDDIRLQAQGDVRLSAQSLIAIQAENDITIQSKTQIYINSFNQDFDSGASGTQIEIFAGAGASGNAVDAGSGGNIEIYAGNAGSSTSGNQATGGNVFIEGGYTTLSGTNGGNVQLRGGGSQDGIEGFVRIGSNTEWIFDANTGAVQCPVVLLAALGLPTPKGKRAMISDSTVAASGNFGAIAVGGGNNTVPVFSNNTNWLIG